MRGHRFPHERARWLSAVLLVAAIIAVSAAVRRWPVTAPGGPRRLASRPLHLIAPPAVLPPARQLAVLSPPLAARETLLSEPAASVPAAELAVAPVDSAAASPASAPAVVAVPSGAVLPLLASRRLELSGSAPMLSAPDVVAVAVRSPSHGLVEMPAVAVTRVVMVAGRGIRTGLRATGAVFRAVF